MLRRVVVLSRLCCLVAAVCLALHPTAAAFAQEPPPPGGAPPPKPPEKSQPPSPAPAATPAPESEVPAAPIAVGATLKGRLLASDRKTTLPGAKVHAIAKDGTVHTSDPADAKGRYHLSGIPPGGYRLAFSTEDGVYMLETEVGISSANVYTVDLAAIPAEAARGTVPGLPLAPRGFAVIVQGTSKSGAGSFWGSAKGITLLAVSAGALGLILSQNGGGDEQSVSPSLP